MALPVVAAGLAGKGAAAIKRRIQAKMGKKGLGKMDGHRRRPKRIVFSERQWMFVQSLMRMVGGRAPHFPGRRRRRRRGPF